MQALELGITTVKTFPANIYGGLKALKALSGPFPQVKFIPTGGVDRNNIDEFLAFDKVEAIICSMTKQEKRNTKILNGSRRLRIAKGSGTTVQDVNKFMKSFEMTQKMMKKMQNDK